MFTHIQEFNIPSIVSKDTDRGRFYTTPDGRKYPSITTILSSGNKDHLTEWKNRVGHKEAEAITRRAGVRGTKFHLMMERYLRNENVITPDIMPDMVQAFRDARSTINRINNIHQMEVALYSNELRVAGRTDVIAEFDGKLSIIDFKTSLREKREEWITNYFLQATAYSIMYEEITSVPVNQIVIIISADGTNVPQVFIKNPAYYVIPLKKQISSYYSLDPSQN